MSAVGLRRRLREWVGRKLSARLVRRLAGLKTNYRFEAIYGDFHLDADYRHHAIGGVQNESGQIRGDLVKLLRDIPEPIESVLLPGEKISAKPIFAGLFGIESARVTTAGLHPEMDWQWDFEQDPPAFGRFACIVSQAMIEHLIDPYKHLRDCAEHLQPGGYLLVHSVLPGFVYHRHPVDCLRFYPDWFEEVGKRLGLAIVDKCISDGHIVYKYRRPA